MVKGPQAQKSTGEKTHAILVSLSPAERKSFLPDNDLAQRIGLPNYYRLVDSTATDAESFAKELAHHRPEILIGSWSTPRLPVPADGSLPVAYFCYLSGSIKKCVPRELLVRGLKVSNWGTSISRYVAECAMMLTLASLRNAGIHQHAMRNALPWRHRHMPAVSLFGRKVGFHGLGSIGREFLKLLQPYKTTCQAWDPFLSATQMAKLGVTPAASLEALYTSSEVLVVFCALTDETRGIIDADLLGRLPPGATFVNVARGELVDETALIEALKNGHLRAGLDVFSLEPLPDDSELRQLPNVVIIPHLGGYTTESRSHALNHGIDNIRRYLNNEPLQSEIGVGRFDRMT